MKTKMLRGWRWILAVSCTATLLGCLDQTRETGAQTIVDPSAAAVSVPVSDSPADTAPVRAVIPPANLSPGLSEIVKLAQSGVSEQVLLAYVEKSNQAFNPSVDEIVYLKDIGISDSVVALMVRHENGTPNQVAPASPNPATAENKMVSEELLTNSTGPSFIDPNAPSYSVAAEPNYSEAATVPQPQQVNINYFESTLSPYGSWVDVQDYGRCWQPTVVVLNRSWRPYSDRGRWLYTSSGWYWQSDYSWGWAPFHYGRWHQDHRIGWVWVPGSTWGPAWVSWRYTDDHCGWAPLPPSARYHDGFYYRGSRVGITFDFGLHHDFYTFIPTSRFCERTPSRYYVSGSHSRTIYNNSVVINNYVRGNNNTVINEGIGRERISRATRTPVRTVTLRELPTTSNPAGRAERLEGNSLSVFRPNVSAPASGRPALQRSVTTTAPATPNSTASRNTRSVTRTEPTTPAQPRASVYPKELEPLRVSPSPATPNSSVATTAPKSESRSLENSSRPAITTRPGTSPSGLRSLPARNTVQERSSVERRAVNPVENLRAPQPNVSPNIAPTVTPRETPVARQPIIRPELQPLPIQQSKPSVREARRQEVREFNPEAQRSLRSPTLSAPPPVQNFNPRQEISRPSHIERPAPQSIPPSFSAPAPSVRQAAPRQETPSPRERPERSVERTSRSERNKN